MLEVYAVEWVGIMYRMGIPRGYRLYLIKEECIEETKRIFSKNRTEKDEYCGPINLRYYVIPFDSLEVEYQAKLRLDMKVHTYRTWEPKDKSSSYIIE